MRTPTRVLAALGSLAVVAGVLSASPSLADSDARLLVVNNASNTFTVGANGARLQVGTDVTNTTKKKQPASNLRVYLRALVDDQQQGRRATAGRRYQVIDKPVRALAAKETIRVGASGILPEKVPAGTYTVRVCIERLLYRNCELTDPIQVAPAVIELTPSEYSFGTVEPEFSGPAPRAARRETATNAFVVTNTGGAWTGDITFSLSGESSFAYEIGATTCTVLRPGATCTVEVTFGYPETGQFTATLTASAFPGGSDSSFMSGTVQSSAD